MVPNRRAFFFVHLGNSNDFKTRCCRDVGILVHRPIVHGIIHVYMCIYVHINHWEAENTVKVTWKNETKTTVNMYFEPSGFDGLLGSSLLRNNT